MMFISKKEEGIFKFYFFLSSRGSNEFKYDECSTCEKCGLPLDDQYVKIINSLREKNLLDDNYEQLCCICHSLMKVGKGFL